MHEPTKISWLMDYRPDLLFFRLYSLSYLFLHQLQRYLDQAPYQEIFEDEYNEWMKKTVHEIDWSRITEYEKEDMTENTKELACTAGACEIV